MKDCFKWYNAQLHNHTRHSDGKDNVSDMIDKLVSRGAELLALTDHNAASGNTEFLAECAKRGIVGIRGNEVSSYYGHVVGLGVEDYIDWRYFSPDCPEEIFDEIHRRKGLCGYAHPIRIGYPIVPSCSWLYTIHDYSKIDYFEILNTGDYLRSRNDMVIDLWIEKLREGFLHLAATSGLDFHSRPFHGHEYVTYVSMNPASNNMEKEAMMSIHDQHMIVCKDELIDICLEDISGRTCRPGDYIGFGELKVKITIPSSYNCEKGFVVTVDDWNGQQLFETPDNIVIRPETFAVVRVYRENVNFENLIAVSNPFHIYSDVHM